MVNEDFSFKCFFFIFDVKFCEFMWSIPNGKSLKSKSIKMKKNRKTFEHVWLKGQLNRFKWSRLKWIVQSSKNRNVEPLAYVNWLLDNSTIALSNFMISVNWCAHLLDTTFVHWTLRLSIWTPQRFLNKPKTNLIDNIIHSNVSRIWKSITLCHLKCYWHNTQHLNAAKCMHAVINEIRKIDNRFISEQLKPEIFITDNKWM